MAMRPLIVGTDGSDQALRAVDWAADEAAARGLPLRIVHASRWSRYDGLSPSLTRTQPASGTIEAEHIVASAAERARGRAPHLEVTTDVSPEGAIQALVKESDGATAVVVGSRGLGTVVGALIGSVSLGIAAYAHCPVIVVRGEVPGAGMRSGRIVAGVGRPDGPQAVPGFAFEEAELRGDSVQVVHAWMLPQDEGVSPGTGPSPARENRQQQAREWLSQAVTTAAADHPDVRHEELEIEGPPKPALVEAAQGARLLVVGVPERRGMAGLPLGTVSHAALHYAPCPVAVVPPM